MAFFESGNIETGKTNAKGETSLFQTDIQEKIFIHFDTTFDSNIKFNEE